MSDHRHVPAPSISGADGELIDLFLGLIDRSPAEHPNWWYDFGVTAGLRVDAVLRPEDGRPALMRLLRNSLVRIVEAGAAEDFLIHALMSDLDEYAARIGDTGAYDAKIDDMRNHLLQVISDPVVRAQWRRIREQQDPSWIGRSDEDFIAEARAGYESFGRKYATVDDAANRWSLRDAWRSESAAVLPAGIYGHWSHRNTQRAIRAQGQ